MITLDTDMYLLCSLFNISSQKLSGQYAGKSVEDIMEAEAAQGNTAAANFDKTVLNDPIKLAELFQLNNVGNKFAILSNMSQQDLEDLLPLLDPQDLLIGLNYFTKDKLLNMDEALPKDQLVKLMLDMFSPEKLMQLMPEEQLNKVLKNPNMDKSLEIKYLTTLKPEILAQMYEATTGMPAPTIGNSSGVSGSPTFDTQKLLTMITGLSDDKFQEALINMPQQNKREFVLKLAKEDPKIYLMFDSHAYTDIINNAKQKEDIIRSSSVIDPQQLVKMMTQLPKDLMAVLLTQIDTQKFASILVNNFKNILSQIAAG